MVIYNQHISNSKVNEKIMTMKMKFETYEQFTESDYFKSKCNTNLMGRSAFENDWLYLFGNGSSISVYLTILGNVLIFDHYYNQTYEDTPSNILYIIMKIGNKFPIGFEGNIYYNFSGNEITKLGMAVNFLDSMRGSNLGKLDSVELKYLCDVVHDCLIETDYDEKEITQGILFSIIEELPSNIISLVNEWGANDTEAREKIYEYILNKDSSHGQE